MVWLPRILRACLFIDNQDQLLAPIIPASPCTYFPLRSSLVSSRFLFNYHVLLESRLLSFILIFIHERLLNPPPISHQRISHLRSSAQPPSAEVPQATVDLTSTKSKLPSSLQNSKMDSIIPPAGDLSSEKAAPLSHPFKREELLASPSSSANQRQYTTISIPSTYGQQNSTTSPGTVVGIVLGSVGGFVLLLYLIIISLNPGGFARDGGFTVDEEVVIRSRHGTLASSRPSSRRRRSEVVEVVEERDSRRPSGPRYRRDRDSDRIVVEESVTATTATEESDLVEVVEEESSAVSSVSTVPRRHQRSTSGRGAYRSVDPREYGGGGSHASRYR